MSLIFCYFRHIYYANIWGKEYWFVNIGIQSGMEHFRQTQRLGHWQSFWWGKSFLVFQSFQYEHKAGRDQRRDNPDRCRVQRGGGWWSTGGERGKDGGKGDWCMWAGVITLKWQEKPIIHLSGWGTLCQGGWKGIGNERHFSFSFLRDTSVLWHLITPGSDRDIQLPRPFLIC